jgi:excisionase family DNA binding protein
MKQLLTEATKKYLTVCEAADLCRISVPAVHKLMNIGKLTRIKPGGLNRVLIPAAEVEALLAGQPAKEAHA